MKNYQSNAFVAKLSDVYCFIDTHKRLPTDMEMEALPKTFCAKIAFTEKRKLFDLRTVTDELNAIQRFAGIGGLV